MRQKNEPSQSGRGIMPLRMVMVCAEQAVSMAAPSDKCHLHSLTLDKGSVHQRCQLRQPAGLIVTFSTAHSERSPRIFPYFITLSADELPFYSAQPFCSPWCFLAPIAQKRPQAAEIEPSHPASQGKAVWAWIQPSKALRRTENMGEKKKTKNMSGKITVRGQKKSPFRLGSQLTVLGAKQHLSEQEKKTHKGTGVVFQRHQNTRLMEVLLYNQIYFGFTPESTGR